MNDTDTIASRYRRSLGRAKSLTQRRPRWAGLKLRVLALAGLLVGPGLPLWLLAAGAGVVWAQLFYLPEWSWWATLAIVGFSFIIVGVFAWDLWRTRVERTSALRLLPNDARPLLDLIERRRRELRVRRMHRVEIALGGLASVEEMPRWGPLGPTRRRLILGVPLLAYLSPEHAEAVVAHELAHTSRAAPTPPPWVRWCVGWWRQRHNSRKRPHPRGLWTRYVLALATLADASSQAGERFADARSADVSGIDTAAEALLHVTVLGVYESRVYWPELRRTQRYRSVPPNLAVTRLVTAIREGRAWAEGGPRIGSELLEQTLEDDTHPSLLDRLHAIGWLEHDPKADPEAAVAQVLAALPPQEATSAWSAWFDKTAQQRVLAVLDRVMQRATAGEWHAVHLDVQHARDSLQRDAELVEGLGDAIERVDASALALDPAGLFRPPISRATADLERTADLVGRAMPAEEAQPVLRSLLAVEDRLPAAHFHLGRGLDERDDPESLAHLDRVADLHGWAGAAACHIAYTRRRRLGLNDDAERDRLRGEALATRLDEFDREQGTLTQQQPLGEHTLTPLALSRLQRHLASYPIITRAYLVRRKTIRYEGHHAHALFIRIKRSWWRPTRERYWLGVQAALAGSIDLHEPVTVWLLNRGVIKGYEKRLRRIERALIYEAAG